MIEGPVLVIGATGNVGGELARQLATVGVPVRALSRRPTPARDGVIAFTADVLDPDGLHGALDGMRQVFLAAPIPVLAAGSRNVARAASTAGVEHIVLLSSSIVEIGADDVSSRAHRVAEAAVTSSGLRTTILRPGSFHSNALRWVAPVMAGDPVPLMAPHVQSAPIDPMDIARVAMVALASERLVPPICALAGPERMSPTDRVRVLAEVLDRTIDWEETPVPEGDLFLEVINHEAVPWAEPTDVVERLTGQPARTFRDWAVRHRSCFA